MTDINSKSENDSVEVQCPNCGVRYSALKIALSTHKEVQCIECEYVWSHDHKELLKKDDNQKTEPLITNDQNTNLIKQDDDDSRGDFDFNETELESKTNSSEETDIIDSTYVGSDIVKEHKDIQNESNNLSKKETQIENDEKLDDLEYTYDSDDKISIEALDSELSTEGKNKENSRDEDEDEFDDLFADLYNLDDEDKSLDRRKQEIIQKKDEEKDFEEDDAEEDDIEEEFDDEIEDEPENVSEEEEDESRDEDYKRTEENSNSVSDNSKNKINTVSSENSIENKDNLLANPETNKIENQESSLGLGEEYEEEYEEEEDESPTKKLLNYFIAFISVILLIGLIGSGGINFYSALPGFMKSGLRVLGINNLSGLKIINIKPQIMRGDSSTFNVILEGTVANLSQENRKVPYLIVKIFDKNGKHYEYTTNINKSSLEAMEYQKFTYRITSLEFEPFRIDVSLIHGINKYVRYKD